MTITFAMTMTLTVTLIMTMIMTMTMVMTMIMIMTTIIIMIMIMTMIMIIINSNNDKHSTKQRTFWWVPHSEFIRLYILKKEELFW